MPLEETAERTTHRSPPHRGWSCGTSCVLGLPLPRVHDRCRPRREPMTTTTFRYAPAHSLHEVNAVTIYRRRRALPRQRADRDPAATEPLRRSVRTGRWALHASADFRRPQGTEIGRASCRERVWLAA